LQNHATTRSELKESTHQTNKQIEKLREANKAGMDHMSTSMAVLPISALVGMASLYKEG